MRTESRHYKALSHMKYRTHHRTGTEASGRQRLIYQVMDSSPLFPAYAAFVRIHLCLSSEYGSRAGQQALGRNSHGHLQPSLPRIVHPNCKRTPPKGKISKQTKTLNFHMHLPVANSLHPSAIPVHLPALIF